MLASHAPASQVSEHVVHTTHRRSGDHGNRGGRFPLNRMQEFGAYVDLDRRRFAQLEFGSIGADLVNLIPGDEQGRVAESEKRQNGHIKALGAGAEGEHIVVTCFTLEYGAAESPAMAFKSSFQTISPGQFSPTARSAHLGQHIHPESERRRYKKDEGDK